MLVLSYGKSKDLLILCPVVPWWREKSKSNYLGLSGETQKRNHCLGRTGSFQSTLLGAVAKCWQSPAHVPPFHHQPSLTKQPQNLCRGWRQMSPPHQGLKNGIDGYKQ